MNPIPAESNEGVRHGKNRLRMIALGAVILTMTILTSTACSSPQTPQTTAAKAPTTATAAPVKTTYPVSVTDISGRSVTVKQKPVRIVSIHPTATEMLYKVGGIAIGRDTSSKYPEEVQSLPTVGSAYNPSVEAVTALNPDLIIIEALSQGRLVTAFEKLGVPVVALRAASLEDVTQSLTLVGRIIDQNDAAKQAIAQINSRIAAATKTTRSGRNTLIFISDADRNVYAAKPESYPGTLLTLLGQNNLAKGLPDSGPYPGFALYTGEQATASKADAVFAISPAPAPAPKLSEMLPRVPGFNQMSAVKDGKIKELDPMLFLQAQGPRIDEAVEQLAKLLNEVAP